MPDEQKVIPAGSMPPEKEDTAKTEGKEEPLLLGKYKSSGELASAHESLQGKLGEQGKELGDIKAQNTLLTKQMNDLMKNSQKEVEEAENAEPPTDYQKELANIYQAVDEGEMSLEEGMKMSNSLTAQLATEEATKEATAAFQKILSERDAQGVQQKFLDENPDFLPMKEAGALDEVVKSSNGLHDDFSAYFALKATEAREQGRAEQASLEEGTKEAGSVLSKPGSTIRQTNNKTPSSRSELRASMLEAVKQSGSGG